MKASIDIKDIAHFTEAYAQDPKNRLAQNAVTRSGIKAVAPSQPAMNRDLHTYSHVIKTPAITDQKQSGRCWLFAGLNVLRLRAMEKMKLDDFEFSQTYLMFWDKLEKANFFLENIIETRSEPLDGRLLMWLLESPQEDGGQWDMFVSLVRKYGVVPKAFMQETFSSGASKTMNADLTAKLREFARDLRLQHEAGASVDALRQAKADILSVIFRMLAIHLGTPPTEFFWEWRDKDKEFHRHGTITPQEFFNTYVGDDLDDMVCLIHAPTADKPFGRTYTVQYLGNVVDGRPVTYLNVEMSVLKQAARDMIVDEQPVWFGCDVGQMFERTSGMIDPDGFDFELVYGTPMGLDKAERLDYGESRMTHAMVFTGVDVDDDGQPRRWRVENSWGDRNGDKGYLSMSDRWFEEYLYEAAVYKRYVPEDLLAALEEAPTVLPPWDPMGALARNAPLRGLAQPPTIKTTKVLNGNPCSSGL
jgi:bleomycin hydrolase